MFVDGGYAFIMPAGEVKVSAAFAAQTGAVPHAAGGNDVSKTGDSAKLALCLVLMCASLGGVLLFGKSRA